MAGLSEAVRKAMQADAERVKERQSSNFTKSWNLTGKNAIVEPGSSVTVRFGPRWSIAVVVDGKLTMNPEYRSGDELIFVKAFEHWWDADGGKTQHAWCPKSISPDAECPVCMSAAYDMKSEDETERKRGKRVSAKEVFIFNAVVGNPRKLADGKADFRIMSVPGTIYTRVYDIMTGGSDESFARGNVGDHKEGYDLKFTRPRKDAQGDRWSVDCAPNPSSLYSDAQKQAFAGWPGMLVNLEEMLVKETKTGNDLFKMYYGRDPEPDEMGGTAPEVPTPPTATEPEVSNPEPDMIDEFMKPSVAATAPKVPTPPKATAPAVAGARPRTGGRR